MDKQMLRVRAMQRIGNVLENEGDYTGAQGSLERALAQAKDDVQRASILNDMGWVLMQRGDLSHANELCLNALKLCGENAARDHLRAQIFDHLGTLAEKRESAQDALSYHQQSLNIKQRLGDTSGVAESANNLGHVYRLLEDADKAMQSFQNSLQLDQQIGNPLGIAMATMNIGNACADKDEVSLAVQYFEEALNMFEKMGHKQGMAMCLDNLAACLEDDAQDAQVREYLNKSLNLYAEIGDPEGEARIKAALAELD
jgi:protein O-GlcNAc transferase